MYCLHSEFQSFRQIFLLNSVCKPSNRKSCVRNTVSAMLGIRKPQSPRTEFNRAILGRNHTKSPPVSSAEHTWKHMHLGYVPCLMTILNNGAFNLKNAFFHRTYYDARANFLHPSSSAGFDSRCLEQTKPHSMCTYTFNLPYFHRTRHSNTRIGIVPYCKTRFEIGYQNKQRSTILIRYILSGRTFCTHPTMYKRLNAIGQPIKSLINFGAEYKRAISLQIEAFWRRHVLTGVGIIGIVSCYLLWQVTYGVASMFAAFSGELAKAGFLAMAATTVACAGIVLRNRYGLNPDKAYRIILRTLNTSSKALEVLGAPLTGSGLRAYVMSGGSLRMKNLRPTISRRRCFLMFPVRGSEAHGFVGAEVKKVKGKYDFRLLAIDVASPGSEQRVFIVGDDTGYKVGGGLISQLRTPILTAMAAQKELEVQDEKEAQQEERAEAAKRELDLQKTLKNDDLQSLHDDES
ncbi:hypothetical protein KP509_06G073100 [Ceratopteris richardii]|uniref:Uncharacterized protein n=1 Tax=Ceratopteris richardii TaxID=49495 RepID=A0A8T2UHF3_CERRI|nr:hypothetical protein KP509_06G073100 [Ceratopteris richardii]